MNLNDLQGALHYRFLDEALLRMALTHPSYGADHKRPHYQRLEFLGDAVLELAVSRYLYDHLPGESEGRLTRIRAALVCESTLCDIAREYKLGEILRLSVGEERSGGREKPSILADVVEALIAAVYLDGGLDAAFSFVYRALRDKLVGGVDIDLADAKTRLQELLQKDGTPAPVYEQISVSGPPHDPLFTVRVLIAGEAVAEGSGRSKQLAQQAAAREAIKRRKKGI